ncbi:MAG: T9SS type A sorting domain-containing protein, partial [Saprospiraceae bacterium]|nr:T9SS type A sorting domain-containing protein [Saprospiraceae bacterium]
ISDDRGERIQESFDVEEPMEISVTQADIEKDDGTGSGSITLESEGGTGSHSFQWSNGESGNPLTGLEAGTYECTISDENGCEESFGPYEVELATFTRDASSPRISIYPVPAREMLCYETISTEVIETSIRDMLGRKVLAGRSTDCIDVSGLSSGVYWLVVELVNGQTVLGNWIKI